ncbi:hypothetical protein ElyMa_000202700 [Elysia marginata]|uniref:Uncharacterized protein n=1 Tax=Elysia marginata TaxID=1093978 RepID=A0AAV4EWY1_9GAST|nr:hypothetical protein ElyMa_000202700 [Elysia marginata]
MEHHKLFETDKDQICLSVCCWTLRWRVFLNKSRPTLLKALTLEDPRMFSKVTQSSLVTTSAIQLEGGGWIPTATLHGSLARRSRSLIFGQVVGSQKTTTPPNT